MNKLPCVLNNQDPSPVTRLVANSVFGNFLKFAEQKEAQQKTQNNTETKFPTLADEELMKKFGISFDIASKTFYRGTNPKENKIDFGELEFDPVEFSIIEKVDKSKNPKVPALVIKIKQKLENLPPEFEIIKDVFITEKDNQKVTLNDQKNNHFIVPTNDGKSNKVYYNESPGLYHSLLYIEKNCKIEKMNCDDCVTDRNNLPFKLVIADKKNIKTLTTNRISKIKEAFGNK